MGSTVLLLESREECTKWSTKARSGTWRRGFLLYFKCLKYFDCSRFYFHVWRGWFSKGKEGVHYKIWVISLWLPFSISFSIPFLSSSFSENNGPDASTLFLSTPKSVGQLSSVSSVHWKPPSRRRGFCSLSSSKKSKERGSFKRRAADECKFNEIGSEMRGSLFSEKFYFSFPSSSSCTLFLIKWKAFREQ